MESPVLHDHGKENTMFHNIHATASYTGYFMVDSAEGLAQDMEQWGENGFAVVDYSDEMEVSDNFDGTVVVDNSNNDNDDYDNVMVWFTNVWDDNMVAAIQKHMRDSHVIVFDVTLSGVDTEVFIQVITNDAVVETSMDTLLGEKIAALGILRS